MDSCAPFNRCTRSQLRRFPSRSAIAVVFLAAALPGAIAQTCLSLEGSTTCPSFSNASINTDLSDLFGFLSFVSDVDSFDSRLRDYIGTDYVQTKYIQTLGCSNVNLTNTTNLYARYTTTFLCNSIVQASLSTCDQNTEVATLCADSCAEFAISEQEIISTPAFCSNPGDNANDEIRADSDRCQHAAKALTGTCLPAVENEPNECGFSSNLSGLCAFCASSSQNSTDSCCVNADVESRCAGVILPGTTTMPPLFTTTSTAEPTGSTAAAAGGSGLSGGAIAGIVIGSILGALAILGAVILGCIYARRRKQNQQNTLLNTPSPTRQAAPGPPMSYRGDGHSPPPPIIPGARVARMSALEGSSSSDRHSSTAGAMSGYNDRLDPYASPESHRAYLGANLPKRDGSLSSRSALGGGSHHSSPHSASDAERNLSSPEGVASGQSEQLQFFKDYYSQDDIRPGDTVATLWAYQPRASDEFELERGDMLKVVGIWDDGWATGVRLAETADEWEARRAVQRDSGVSNGSRRSGSESDGEIKAFPLVCVCLPQHWRKTIEGDSSDTGGSGGDQPPPSP